MKRAMFILSGFLSTISCFAQIGGRLQVAVMPIEGSGIDASAILSLTDRLRSELISTGHFEVMERAKMDEILSEQGFQQSGACTSNECLVEAGKMLGVECMIASSIGRVGNVYTAAARVIDIETGRVKLSKTEDCRDCPIDDMLVTGMRNLAQKLTGSSPNPMQPGPVKPVMARGKGDFYFKSDPPEAKVFLDGQLIPGQTPNSAEEVDAGMHIVEMKTDIFSGRDSVFLEPGEFKRVELVLKQASGGIKVISQPFEAAILIDDKPYGTTPKTIFELPAGMHTVTLKKEGYADQTEQVLIKANETTRTVQKLRALSSGLLKIVTSIPEAEIFIDNKSYGLTPKTIAYLPVGMHLIKIKKMGFLAHTQEVVIKDGQQTTIECILKEVACGGLQVFSTPDGAKLFVDNQIIGMTPQTISNLEVGYHAVKISKTGYGDHREQILIKHNKTTVVRANLRHFNK